MMDRRMVLCGLGSGLLLEPLAADAQPAGKVYRVGLILTTSPVSELAGPDPIHPGVRAFVHGLRDLGYVEGRNLVLERRSAEGRFERFGEIVVALVRGKIDVIVTIGDAMTKEAKRVTNAVPIVMANSYDPVGAGIVASLARPGGNITGVTDHTGPEHEASGCNCSKKPFPKRPASPSLG